ncbi:MAG TPA: hypothetical protein VHE35_19565 [Kofleriaceae bacterium]|nr:hypothetical protein [Kofleriaceae bacterium]
MCRGGPLTCARRRAAARLVAPCSALDPRGGGAITFDDDNTFELKDPFAKIPKNAATLIFERQ